MDDVVIKLISDRMERIENKVDVLLEFKWKVVGGTILASLILTGLFQIVLALAEQVRS